MQGWALHLQSEFPDGQTQNTELHASRWAENNLKTDSVRRGHKGS